MGKDIKIHFTKEDIHVADKHIQRCQYWVPGWFNQLSVRLGFGLGHDLKVMK